MVATVRFIQEPPPPGPELELVLSPNAITILDIAPCLGDTGKRLLDAGELYRLFLAFLDGVFPIPATPFGNPLVVTGPGNITVPLGVDYVPVRQATPAAITITLPSGVGIGYSVLIKDSLGVCVFNPFTITTSNGALIDGQPTFLFQFNYQAQLFVFDGTEWGVTG